MACGSVVFVVFVVVVLTPGFSSEVLHLLILTISVVVKGSKCPALFRVSF